MSSSILHSFRVSSLHTTKQTYIQKLTTLVFHSPPRFCSRVPSDRPGTWTTRDLNDTGLHRCRRFKNVRVLKMFKTSESELFKTSEVRNVQTSASEMFEMSVSQKVSQYYKCQGCESVSNVVNGSNTKRVQRVVQSHVVTRCQRVVPRILELRGCSRIFHCQQNP